ncbi:hypothetical protein KBX37_04540 [Micromonospora sp. U56]|uniref:hypothetical protein n=1 Tax=Micromonospora sp. U56 TaxID=2824900 RepID=UPI001B397002|nr:hypothetical protein [Micromonospora sp. U56]MBQ0892374.1 hypothetical protein [Micromonospora sp. U56]
MTTTKLTVHDIRTGRPTFTAIMPGWPLRTRLGRRSFSPDWSTLVWDNNCEVRLAKRAGDGTYRQVGAWQPPGWTSRGDGPLCYWAPTFSGGRVWLVVGPTGGGAGKVASFDPAALGSQPREEQAEAVTLDAEGHGATRIDVVLNGREGEGSSGTLVASEHALVSAEVRLTTDTNATSVLYDCRERVDHRTLLCFALGSGQVYGAVALLTADRGARTIALRQGVPNVKGGLRGAYLAPDHKRVALHTDDGWYLADLGTGRQPRKAFPQLDTEGAEVLFWA